MKMTTNNIIIELDQADILLALTKYLKRLKLVPNTNIELLQWSIINIPGVPIVSGVKLLLSRRDSNQKPSDNDGIPSNWKDIGKILDESA